MRINPEKINLLKKPFGVLIRDEDITKEVIHSLVLNSVKIITVGDATTQKLIDFGIIPDIAVIDGQEKRVRKNKIIEYPVEKKIYLENRQGEINEEVIALIKELVEKRFGKVQIIIHGEEDLIALPFFMYSPDRWTIFYGQPNEGLVCVEIDKKSRENAKSIFNKVIRE